MTDPTTDLLQTYCATTFKDWDKVQVSQFGRLAEGWESVIYGYERAAGRAVEQIEYFEVCFPARRVYQRLFDITGMRVEPFEAMPEVIH